MNRVHPTATIHGTAIIGDGAIIGKRAFVGEGGVIEEGAFIGERATIREGASIGEGIVVPAWSQIRLSASHNPICITGGELPITIEDTLITVGCESLTLAEWEAWALERYPILHQLRGAIVALARSHHQGGVRK